MYQRQNYSVNYNSRLYTKCKTCRHLTYYYLQPSVLTWPGSHRTLENEFVLIVLKKQTSNQNTASNNYFVLIGQLWSRSTKLVFKSFMMVRLEILPWNKHNLF